MTILSVIRMLVSCAGFARPPWREGRERRRWSNGESDIYLAVIHFGFCFSINYLDGTKVEEG